MDLHTSAFILKQMQQEAHGFQDSLKTIIRELAANSTKVNSNYYNSKL